MYIKDIGEFPLIEKFRRTAFAGADTRVGIGDDAAVLGPPVNGRLTLFTADMLVEGRHFDLSAATPRQVGRKALACSLSDIAAMGGRPRAAVVSLGVPGGRDVGFCEELYAGINDLARRFDCGIVGGDTVGTARRVIVSVALLGDVKEDEVALRSGARAGDRVWVTGRLGGSGAGKHLTFTPRVEEAGFLVTRFPVTAMIDLSDGLANDSHRIAEASGVGMRIEAGALPLDREALGNIGDSEAVERALYDGEDFELLVVCGPDVGGGALEGFGEKFDCGITRVGEIVEGDAGVTLAAGGTVRPLHEGGFRHFE